MWYMQHKPPYSPVWTVPTSPNQERTGALSPTVPSQCTHCRPDRGSSAALCSPHQCSVHKNNTKQPDVIRWYLTTKGHCMCYTNIGCSEV